MTSKKYLKFLAIMNILVITFPCLWIYISINYQKSLTILFIFLFLMFIAIILEVKIPKVKGINSSELKSNSTMKQSILHWVKDERELMAALKTYADGYVSSTQFLYLIIFLILILIALGSSSKQILSLLIIILYFENIYLNIKFILDFDKYSNAK